MLEKEKGVDAGGDLIEVTIVMLQERAREAFPLTTDAIFKNFPVNSLWDD